MPVQEKGKWEPYNVDFLVNNVRSVFKNRDINKLSKATYKFITLHMSFIAHYDLYGFMNSYKDLNLFARTLQTSEYSEDSNYNLRSNADRYDNDKWFSNQYGEGYTSSVARAIRGIVQVARDFQAGRLTKTTAKTRVSTGTRKRKANPVEPLLGSSTRRR